MQENAKYNANIMQNKCKCATKYAKKMQENNMMKYRNFITICTICKTMLKHTNKYAEQYAKEYVQNNMQHNMPKTNMQNMQNNMKSSIVITIYKLCIKTNMQNMGIEITCRICTALSGC